VNQRESEKKAYIGKEEEEAAKEERQENGESESLI
jgi:hypothetical protein